MAPGPPSPPGTPRVKVLDGGAQVRWAASQRATQYNIICADLVKGSVGFAHVEHATEVLIENVSGKYRLDVVALNEEGEPSSAKQCYFECGPGALEELDQAVPEWAGAR